ncbi:MAG: diguanylate cyclase [Chitinispirillaceae bacterium]|nr:diguanylate cyclase [Chitinispirillaceae bacterium]
MNFNIENISCKRILDQLHDGLYLVDRQRKIIYWNKAAEQITGFLAEEVMGRFCSDNILTHVDKDGKSLCLGLCPLAMTITDGENRAAEIYLHHKNGHRIPVAVRISTILDPAGNSIGAAELFSDISGYKAIEARAGELEKLALLDSVTRLANRHYIDKEIDIRFEERKRTGITFGVIFIDIDHFKQFNDTYGHDIGDRVLKVVADTLARNSRPFDTVGRWGGEEFIVVARNVTAPHLEDIGNRLRMLVENAYILVERTRVGITVSLGATCVTENDTPESLVKRADRLLYESKKAGRNRLTLG